MNLFVKDVTIQEQVSIEHLAKIIFDEISDFSHEKLLKPNLCMKSLALVIGGYLGVEYYTKNEINAFISNFSRIIIDSYEEIKRRQEGEDDGTNEHLR
jgi:hypothetical protein